MEYDFWCTLVVFAIPFVVLLIADRYGTRHSGHTSEEVTDATERDGRLHGLLDRRGEWYQDGSRGSRLHDVSGYGRRSQSDFVDPPGDSTKRKRSRPPRTGVMSSVVMPDIGWQDFKLYLTKIIEYRGLDIRIVKPTVDGRGIDMTAVSRGNTKRTYLILGKRMQEVVTEPEIREFSDRVASRRAAKGIVITTTTFSHEAFRFAEGKPLELMDGYRFQLLLGAAERRHTARQG